MATGALGFLFTEEDGLELVSTLFTAVFENRHRDSNQFQGDVSHAIVNSATRIAGDDKTIIDAGT